MNVRCGTSINDGHGASEQGLGMYNSIGMCSGHEGWQLLSPRPASSALIAGIFSAMLMLFTIANI